MSRVATYLRISIARRHARELIAVSLAGIGLGVGIAALALGNGGTKQRVALSARTQSARTSNKPTAPATAGVQPGREESEVYGYASGQSQPEAAASQHIAPVLGAGAKASFARLAARLPGPIELTIAPLGVGTPETLGGDQAAHGWSTTKIPVLTALLQGARRKSYPRRAVVGPIGHH